MIKQIIIVAVLGVALSYAAGGSDTTEAPEACDPKDCTVSGECRSYQYCERNNDITLSPDLQTGVRVHGRCDDGLWFNPAADNSTVHGGTCDKWGNLDVDTRAEYQRDCVCNFFSLGDCSSDYIYQDEAPEKGSDNWVNQTLSCPTGLFWNNDNRICSKKDGC